MAPQSNSPRTHTADDGQQTAQGRSVTIYLWLATVPICWGFNFVCLKILYSAGFTVPAILSARYIIMAISLGICLLVLEDDLSIDREDWKYLGIFALITVAIYQFVFAKGIEMTTATESSLLITTAPIWVFLITLILGTEQYNARRMVGVVVGFTGVAMVILGSPGTFSGGMDTNLAGDLVMIAAAILWASYAVFSRPLLKKYSPMKLVAYMHILGSIIIIPVGFNQLMAVEPWSMGIVPWLCILQYSLLAGVYAFMVWYRGVQTIGASQTMLFQYFVPIVALVAAYLILKEEPTWVQIVGVLVTLSGVHAARKHNSEETGVETGEI